MALKCIDDSIFSAIANAIRGKNGKSDKYKPSEMAAAITALETGGGIKADLLLDTNYSRTITSTSANVNKSFDGITNLCKYPFLLTIVEDNNKTPAASKFCKSINIIANKSYETGGADTTAIYGAVVYFDSSAKIATMSGASSGYGIIASTFNTAGTFYFKMKTSSSTINHLDGTFNFKIYGITL